MAYEQELPEIQKFPGYTYAEPLFGTPDAGVVIATGLLNSPPVFEEMQRLFAENGYPCAVVDYPHWGYEDIIEQRVGANHRAVDALRDLADVDRVIEVSYSFGGQDATETAVRMFMKEHDNGIVQVDGFAPVGGSAHSRRLSQILNPISSIVGVYYAMMNADKLRVMQTEAQRLWGAFGIRIMREAFVANGADTTDAMEVLDQLASVLVAQTYYNHDDVVPIPRTPPPAHTIREIKKGNHFSPLVHPDVVVSAVIKRHEARDEILAKLYGMAVGPLSSGYQPTSLERSDTFNDLSNPVDDLVRGLQDLLDAPAS